MTEPQNPDRKPGVPPDPAPSSDPDVTPRHPKNKKPQDASPETLAENESAPREVEREFENALTRLPPD